MRYSTKSILALAVVVVLFGGVSLPAFAQTRVSDKDVENMLKNLKEDSEKFRSSFESALEKGTLRNTSQERDAKELVKTFEKQVEGTLDQFESKKKADAAFQTVLTTATQINKLLIDHPMGRKADADWAKVRSEVNGLAKALGVESSLGGSLN